MCVHGHSICDPADPKGPSSRKYTHFKFSHPTILSGRLVEMHAKTYLGHKFPHCWNWHQFPWGHAVRHSLCQLIPSHLSSGNIQSCRSKAETPASPVSVHFTSHHPSPSAGRVQSKIRIGQGNSGHKIPGDSPTWGIKKTLKGDLPLLQSWNIKSISPCFSPYMIFNTLCAFLRHEAHHK